MRTKGASNLDSEEKVDIINLAGHGVEVKKIAELMDRSEQTIKKVVSEYLPNRDGGKGK